MQKYLGVMIDHRKFQVANVCKKMVYYLYLKINFHQKELPIHILQMLVDSLVLSQLNYACSTWVGPIIEFASDQLSVLSSQLSSLCCVWHAKT